MQNNKQIKTQRRLTLLIGIILIINPVIIYLIVGKIWVSFVVPLCIIIVTVLIIESQKLKILSTIWLNILFVLSLFLHAEIIFTYRFGEYIIEDLYTINKNYYFNRPYLDKTFQDKEFLVKYKTNAQGFRIGAEDDPEVKVEQCDWLFIGDSYTQGAQVEYEKLYTSRLFDHQPNKVIVNAGISGLGIVDEYYYYIREGKNLNADKVFLQICNFNDFMQVEKRNFGFSDYLMHYSNFARFILYDFKYANPAELPLGRWTEPFYPDEKSNKDYNIFYRDRSEKKKKDLENFQLYLKKFAKAVRENGAELIVLQIPTKEQVSYKYLNEVLNAFQINIEKLDMNFPNQWLADQCRNNEIEHIDLLEDFMHSEIPLFFDFDEHLNVNGHEQIAISINRHLFSSSTNPYPVKLLSTLNVGDRYPVFSGDNRFLLFQSWRDGNMELFIADSTLQTSERLTWNKVDEIHPWPSPDGKQIVFTEGEQSLNKTKVAIMDISTNNRRYITNDVNTYGAIPAYNYQGDKITYAEWFVIDEKLTNPYIVVHDLTTQQKQTITTDEYESWRPIFSPDDKKLFYIARNNNQFDIYEYVFKNNSRRNLTKSNYDEWDAAISRDGKRLVYAGRKNNNWDLFLIDIESGQKIQLTDSKGDEWDPTFSPCGKFIYYAGTYGLRNGIFRMTLY